MPTKSEIRKSCLHSVRLKKKYIDEKGIAKRERTSAYNVTKDARSGQNPGCSLMDHYVVFLGEVRRISRKKCFLREQSRNGDFLWSQNCKLATGSTHWEWSGPILSPQDTRARTRMYLVFNAEGLYFKIVGRSCVQPNQVPHPSPIPRRPVVSLSKTLFPSLLGLV